MKLKHKLAYIIKSPVSYFRSKKYSKPQVLSDEATLDYILEHNCSVSRFGDGELNLMQGIGIKFQSANGGLKRRLCEIAASYKSAENVLVCLPNIFDSLNGLEGVYGRWWENHLKYARGYWYKFFRGEIYGDTNITRFYVENVDKERDSYVAKIKSLWQGKRVLIVEGSKSRIGMGNDLFCGAKSVKRLICPPADAFDRYDAILAETDKHIFTGEFDMVIGALGPTATVLCYDIADKIQALDLGHIDVEYEWYLSGAQTKQAVKNKSVTEVTADCDDEVDDAYLSQIVGEIK